MEIRDLKGNVYEKADGFFPVFLGFLPQLLIEKLYLEKAAKRIELKVSTIAESLYY